jgi:hypothetical protein
MEANRIVKFENIDLYISKENYVLKKNPVIPHYYGITLIDPVVGKKVKAFDYSYKTSTSTEIIVSIETLP